MEEIKKELEEIVESLKKYDDLAYCEKNNLTADDFLESTYSKIKNIIKKHF